MKKYFISRRNVIKGAFLGLFATFFAKETFAATGIIQVSIAKRGATSLVFLLTGSESVKAYVEYGYQKDSLSNKSSIMTIARKSQKEIQIENLKPGTTVFYRVRYLTAKSKSYLATSIKSAKTDQILSANTFAIQADPHMDQNSSEAVYLGTLQEVVKAAPAFLMDLGDIFMVDKLPDKSEANIRARFELMKGYYTKLGNIPLKITLGNHDGELGYSKFNTKKYRKEYFPEQTGDLAYYSFEGPDQLHVVLDPFTYTTQNPKDDGWQWTLGKLQYDWLVKTLQSSNAPHKFIYIHHLLVGNAQSRGGVEIAHLNEWGGKNNDGSYGFDQYRAGWGKPIHTILVENKVGFVFKGHDHLYVKQELDGIIYQTVPQPSHPGDKLDVKQYGYLSGKGVGGSGFIKVRTDGPVAYVDFVKFDGYIADSYTRSAL